jgi:hypothetical protein
VTFNSIKMENNNPEEPSEKGKFQTAIEKAG